MTIEYYHYGQGKLWSRVLSVGSKWTWWADVSELTQAVEVEKVSHRESYSGRRGLVRDFPIGNAITINGVLHQFDATALARLVYGEVTAVTAGAVVAEPLGTVALGDTVKLDFAGVTDLVITDSATPTAATIAGSHYELDGRFGSIEFLSLPTSPAPTMPLKAAYSHSACHQVGMLTQPQQILQLRYEGVNLAEGNSPVLVEWYRASTDPLRELALINTGQQLGRLPFALSCLLDASKPATGAMGQFGRITHVPEDWAA